MENNLISCKICGKQSTRIYGAHLKSHGLSSVDYKKMFPGEPLYSNSDKLETSKNSGKHMKQDKYKKMFSEKIKGDNNPNSKSKTTEEQRKERSPFSKKFIKYENENQSIDFSKNVNKNIGPEKRPNKIEYWINKGYTEEESIEKVKERQSTFSLKKCIEKYGEKLGEEKFKERQLKWQDSLNRNGNLKCGFSRISQKLFYKILENINIEEHKNIFFAVKNNEFILNKNNGNGIWIYDFADIKRKKIIEYNGDEYHANPNYFEKNEMPHPFRKQYTSEQIWLKDKLKIDTAKDNGFDILIIWDSEYKNNPDKVISECLKFLE